MKTRKVSSLFSVFLVVLLLFQMNALPIHEYNLRQQGYTLIHVEPWKLGDLPEKMTFSFNGKEYYNTALCGTHFQINILKQFHEIAFLALACLGLIDFLSKVQFESSFFQKDDFLASVSCRAPPVLM